MDIVKTSKTEGKALEAIKIIKQLYAVEKEAREKQLSFDNIKQLRQEKAKPIVEAFNQWLHQALLTVPPQGPAAKAMQYALNQWPALLPYLEKGELMIDNNAVENAIRPFALGRKNWLFLGNERGATAAANTYSLIMTAKANQCDPYLYLRYLLEQLPCCKTDEQRRLLLPQHCKVILQTGLN
jgi:transposase